MADIKTRDAVKGTIKTLDKAAIAGRRMKSAYAKTKDKAEQGYYAEENSPTEYAADKVSYASGRIKDEGIHQFNKQGQKNAEAQERISVSRKIKSPTLRQSGRRKPQSRKQCGIRQDKTPCVQWDRTACRKYKGLQAVPLFLLLPLPLPRPRRPRRRQTR